MAPAVDELVDLVDVAIVGGGFSGVTVAAQLALLAPDLRVMMFERRERVGPGLAYSSAQAGYFANSRARHMSAFEDDPDHFVRWLDGRATPETFVPRALYGEYLASIAAALSRGGLVVVPSAALAIVAEADGMFRLQTANGRQARARAVVIATGNLGFEIAQLPLGLTAHPRFVADPWSAEYAGMRGDVLIVGTGLTALDALVALDAVGFAGTIHTVSRHGLFPRVDTPFAAYAGRLPLGPTENARAVVRETRKAIATSQRDGHDWRAVVEAFRREIPRVWGALDLRERGRLLRHARRYWDVHRHRSTEPVDALRARLLAEGRLVVHRGRIVAGGVDADDNFVIDIAGRDGSARIGASTVISALGPLADYRRCVDPLIRSLLDDGWITTDPLALGLVEARAGIYLAGPAERASDYEATAVPELRRKAEALAARIAAYLRR